MIKDKIKVTILIILITSIIPTICEALDKEDLLNYLVNSSYPEVKIIDKESEGEHQNSEKDVYNEKSETTKNTEENDEFVNVYVGEENKPKVEDEKIQQSSNLITQSYENDIKITKEQPQILIYHTHSSETYSDSPEGNYHSTNIANSVMAVGESLCDELNKRGWGVIHTIKYNDLKYNEAYANSANTIKSILSQHNSVKIAIDLHRDGKSLKTQEVKNDIHENSTIDIDGESVAKFFLVVGQRNDNVSELKRQAQGITDLAEKKYPGLVQPVVTKQYGRYNQYLTESGLLIEIGNNATSTKEALATTKYVAEILNEYYADKK